MKIGKYRICGLLGRGGMGRVYRIEIPTITKIAALKLLDPNPHLIDLMGLDRIQALFLSEAKTMAHLRHPNILDVWDYGRWQDKPYYLMDYHCHSLGDMIGEDYRAELPSRVLSVDKAIHYTRQILTGLTRLHQAGIIHRDIKPHNMLLTDQDTLKICDFGASRLRGERYGGPSNLKVGTPWYAPPDQETDPDGVGPDADLYAVGTVVYRMLTGKLPADQQELRQSELASHLNPDLDLAWDGFLATARHLKPRKRFADAQQMINALNGLAAEWEQRKAQTCEVPPELSDQPLVEPVSAMKRRWTEVKVGRASARHFFRLDRLWRPAQYANNRFERVDGQTLVDHISGLRWQIAGSPYPLTWQGAWEYIDRLNDTRTSLQNAWRLPTVDELVSLLKPTPHGSDHCLEPMFDTTQKWLWSCDRCSYTSAWWISVDLGFVARQEYSAYLYVRAVCDA